jgi:hypothetical protein
LKFGLMDELIIAILRESYLVDIEWR